MNRHGQEVIDTATTDFAMQYDSIEALIDEVKKAQERFDAMRNNLAIIADTLDDRWEGAAQVEFSAAYRKLEPKLETIGEVLSDYVKALQSVIKSEITTEKTNASLFARTDVPAFGIKN